jgi:hypothetical protein
MAQPVLPSVGAPRTKDGESRHGTSTSDSFVLDVALGIGLRTVEKLLGRWIKIGGWMHFDVEHQNESENTAPGRERNWRATAWEIHPITVHRGRAANLPNRDSVTIWEPKLNPSTGTCSFSNDVAKSSVVLDRELEEKKSHDTSGSSIRCPLCGWSPRKEDKWFCTCGNEWNTFETGGVCPACLHQWAETQCLSCSRWSAHTLWYAHS